MTDQPHDLDQIEAAVTAYLDGHLHVEAYCGPAHAMADAATAMAAEIRRLRAALDEMTHCRDNALRALYRDDVDTDIDLEETIGAPFYGPGWDWDEADLQCVVREAANAVRPAFGKLTQQRDKARQRAREHGELAARRESELITLRDELAATHAKTLCTEADEIVLHCPDHSPQDQDGVWMDCHCAVADDMRRRATARAAAEETHVVADDSSGPEPTDRCGARHYQHPDTVCTEPADHYRPTVDPHAGPLILDGRECGGAAWDDPAAVRP